jgi:hypothetical protein
MNERAQAADAAQQSGLPCVLWIACCIRRRPAREIGAMIGIAQPELVI